MARPLAAQASNSFGINDGIKLSVNDKEFTRAVRRLIVDIIDGTMNGMESVQQETYKEALGGLNKFKHTSRKESLKGLVKKQLKHDIKSDSYLAEVSQLSIAGKVLEYKGYHAGIQKNNTGITSHHSGIISLSNPNQPRAHIWLREHNMTGARLSKESQISPIGPMKNVRPMQDAVKNYLEPKGIKEISDNIVKKIKTVYN